MKRIIAILLLCVLCVSLIGCGKKELVYYGNLGYDLNRAEGTKITFHIYHSNNENHYWKQVASLSCEPEYGHSCDIQVNGMDNKVRIIVKENYVMSETGYSEDIDSYEFPIEGFQGFISDFQTFEVKDIAGEQIYRLYPISNENGIYFPNLALEEPYDINCENIDNILITITIR